MSMSSLLTSIQRANMFGPAKLAEVAVLLNHLHRIAPWPTVDDPLVFETTRGRWSGYLRAGPPPPACPASPVRAAVLPALDVHQALVLDLAADVAIHGRWQLWSGGWQLRAAGANRCTRGDDCAWCVWRRDPRPETLPAFRVWSNPFLPEAVW